ncbi:MAG: bile acid:sodium symporter family protein [Mariprofundaceae bacterium]|nr:bile acid:sodium symporter family protein [Mariprofundaceae bacterium]
MFKWITKNMAILTLVSAVVAYLYPALFLPVKGYFLWLFAATMFAVGLVLPLDEAKAALKDPKSIVIGVMSQYSIMPLLGFAAAGIVTWLGFPPALALGFIIVGCAPGAMASNVMTYLAGGAVAFSIAMTMLATMLSPLVTPALMQLLGGVWMPIPFWPMMQTIFMIVVLPLFIAMLLKPKMHKIHEYIEHSSPALASLAIIIICSYAVAANQERIAQLSMWIVLMVVIVNALGYVLGWLVATVFSFKASYKVTLMIEIGMQNAGLGVALALEHFEPQTALPAALFAVWCIVTTAALTHVIRKK